jgi:hypothetical protein
LFQIHLISYPSCRLYQPSSLQIVISLSDLLKIKIQHWDT